MSADFDRAQAKELIKTIQEALLDLNALLSQEPQPQQQATPTPQEQPTSSQQEVTALTTVEGKKLATVVSTQKGTFNIIPEESLTLNVKTPPFTNFFVERILLKIRNKDLEQKKATAAFNYHLIVEGDILREIKLENASEERQKEIGIALRWTFTKMLEKQQQEQPQSTTQPQASQPTQENIPKGLQAAVKDQFNQPAATTTTQPQPTPYTPTKPTGLHTIQDIRMMFPEDLDALLSFEEKPDRIVYIKPKQFLTSERFSKVFSIVRGLGGNYVSQGKDSRFEVLLQGGGQ